MVKNSWSVTLHMILHCIIGFRDSRIREQEELKDNVSKQCFDNKYEKSSLILIIQKDAIWSISMVSVLVHILYI